MWGCLYDMDEVSISQIIFEGLHPHLMAAMTMLLAGIYLFKYLCRVEGMKQERRPIYLLRACIWGLFSAAWWAFPYLDLVVSRSILRAMVAIIVLTEISYDLLYIKDAFKEMWRWIYKESSRTRR